TSYGNHLANTLLFGATGATSTNVGHQDIKQHLRVSSLEILGSCKGCPAGGAGGSSSGAAGTVQFSDGASGFSGDADNFFWNNTTKRLGIATGTPGATLAVHGPALFGNGTTTHVSGLITPSIAATGTLGFYTTSAAAPRMVIDASGNVGIGTTSPLTIFTLEGSDPAITLSDISVGGGLWKIQNGGTAAGTDAFAILDGTAGRGVRFGIDNQGDVRIGNGSPGADLDVNESKASGSVIIRAFNSSNSSGNAVLQSVVTGETGGNAQASFLISGGSAWSVGLLNADGNKFTISSSTLLGTDVRFTIDGSGNVGVGTTAPSALLSVGGNALFGTGSSDRLTVNAGTIYHPINATSTIRSGGRFAWTIATSTSAAPIFQIDTETSNGSAVVIGGTSAGGGTRGAVIIGDIGFPTDLGVATETPGALLSVHGPALIVGTTTSMGGLLTPSISATSSLGFYVNAAAPRLLINSSGNVGIGSTTPNLSLSVAGNVNLNLVDGGNAAVCHTNSLTETTGVTLGDCSGAPAQDYAEFYPTASGTEFGDILVTSGTFTQTRPTAEIASSSLAVLTKSSRPYDPTVIGIASNNYGDFTSTGHGTIMEGDHPMPVALVGRVPVKVSTEGGAIKAGDRITTSSLAGIGMKATSSGPTVGIALADFDDQSEGEYATVHGEIVKRGTILVFVNLSYARLDSGLASVADGAPWTVDPDTGRVVLGYALDMQNQAILNVRSIIAASGLWSIDENGALVVEELTAKSKLQVGTPENPRGITLFDFDSGQPSCVFVQGGQVRSVPGECTFDSPISSQSPPPAPPPPSSNETPPPAPSAVEEPPPAEESSQPDPEPDPASSTEPPAEETPPTDNTSSTEGEPAPDPTPSAPAPEPESEPAPAEPTEVTTTEESSPTTETEQAQAPSESTLEPASAASESAPSEPAS
ncbi:hypothetical protein C4552_00005, partial [Candidatus Parcubacteria bacterium]